MTPFKDKYGWFVWDTHEQQLDFERLVDALGLEKDCCFAPVVLFDPNPWNDSRIKHGAN